MSADWRNGGPLTKEELEQMRLDAGEGERAHRTAIDEVWWQRAARGRREAARRRRRGAAEKTREG